jgi:hypothetical protein
MPESDPNAELRDLLAQGMAEENARREAVAASGSPKLPSLESEGLSAEEFAESKREGNEGLAAGMSYGAASGSPPSPEPVAQDEVTVRLPRKTAENSLVDAILAAGYSKSRSPAPAPTLSAVEVDYLLAEEVIQRAVQGLDFAEDAQTVILPVKRCELEGVQMVAYIDGPTLEDLLCKSLDVERYRVVPAGRSPAEVPPNWKASEEVMKILGPTEFLSSTHHGHLFFSPEKLEQLLDAVWRSAQQ